MTPERIAEFEALANSWRKLSDKYYASGMEAGDRYRQGMATAYTNCADELMAATAVRSDEGRPCSEIIEPPVIAGRPLTLVEWLKERIWNAQKLAQEKQGADREGWLSDCHYFRAALQAAERERQGEAK